MVRVMLYFAVAVALATGAPGRAPSSDAALPAFGRDTVLVWKISNQDEAASFVVRIAEFLPNRSIQWENSTTHRTIFMTQNAVTTASTFANARPFDAWAVHNGKHATTL